MLSINHAPCFCRVLFWFLLVDADGRVLAGAEAAEGAVVPAEEQHHHHENAEAHTHRDRHLWTHKTDALVEEQRPFVVFLSYLAASFTKKIT